MKKIFFVILLGLLVKSVSIDAGIFDFMWRHEGKLVCFVVGGGAVLDSYLWKPGRDEARKQRRLVDFATKLSPILSGDVDRVLGLLNSGTCDGQTLLKLASLLHVEGVTVALVDNGVTMDSVDEATLEKLFLFPNLGLARRALAAGLNPNAMAWDVACLCDFSLDTLGDDRPLYSSPLIHRAAVRGKAGHVALLLVAGVDPDFVNEEGRTSLKMIIDKCPTNFGNDSVDPRDWAEVIRCLRSWGASGFRDVQTGYAEVDLELQAQPEPASLKNMCLRTVARTAVAEHGNDFFAAGRAIEAQRIPKGLQVELGGML